MTLSTDQALHYSASAIDGRIPLELRIAVTGHRKLADAPGLSTAVDLALDMIEDQLRPGIRDRCRLVVISALADGVDRVVADRVLARPRARFEAIRPEPEADHVTDFEPTGSLPEFDQLEASWAAPMPPCRTGQDGDPEADRAVTDWADVTVTICDGHSAAGEGGTGYVGRFLPGQRRPWIRISPDGGEVVAENLEELADAGWLGMQDSDLARICEFNKPRLDGGRFAAAMDGFRQRILGISTPDLTADLTGLVRWLQGPLARAELLSKRYQSRYLRLSALLFAFAAAAVCLVATQLVFFPRIRLIVAAEIACLVIILVALEWGRRTHLQQRWISARYLAERLRSAFFLALIGAEEESSVTASVSGDIPVAPWVGIAFDMFWTRRPKVDTDRNSAVSLRRFLSHAWVDDQRRYFKNASEAASSKYLFSTRAVEALFALSVVIAIVHVALGAPEDWGKHVVSLLAIGIPACAAALAGYSTQREYHRTSLRYSRMAQSLADANHLMLAAADRPKLLEIAATVDRMLRQERGEWFGTASLHELELPA